MRKSKGFTLIELMIVIAIIAIIAAIAIPNLLQSRIRANESNAVTQIRNYAAAQSIFEARDCGLLGVDNRGREYGVNADGYCASYPLLYSGTTVVGSGTGTAEAGGQLRLIGVGHANAAYTPGSAGTTDPDTGATVGETPAGGVPFNGYLFTEASEAIAKDGFFDYSYAQIAIPENTDRTGSRAFFFDDNGTPYSRLLEKSKGASDYYNMTTPLDSTATGWML